MDPLLRFTSKAERYARYRWGYAPEAIQAIFDITGLTAQAILADIGSGTGLLTKGLVSKVTTVYAIEPNLAMRQIAERLLKQFPSFISLDGKAEAIPLPDRSVDLITVGQAIHWFEPQDTRKEFQRVLKPEGWLAMAFHTTIRQAVLEAVKVFFTEEYGWDPTPSPKPLYGDSHVDFYIGSGTYTKMHFPQTWQENWDVFIGGILSDSHSPDDTHPAFPRFVSAVRQVFDQFSIEGIVQIHGGTDLVIGRLRKETTG
jgi:SAM-dependent methyltransferase